MSTVVQEQVGDQPSTHGPQPGRAAVLRGSIVPAVVGLLIGFIFVGVYLAAFHDPRPHDVPVAVLAPHAVVEAVDAASEDHGEALDVMPVHSAELARDAVRTHAALGALVVDPAGAELVVAGANGPSVTATLQGALRPVAAAAGTQLTVTDVSELTAGDSRGLSVFYAAFGVVLAAFLFGLSSQQVGAGLPSRWRAVSVVGFAVVAGLLIAWLMEPVFGTLPAPFLLTAAIIGLLALAVASTTAALLRAFGPAGTFVASVVLLVFGNATSTGILPAQFLPGWLEPLTGVLPVGVAVRALRGAAYFDGDGVILGLLVLAGWVVVAVALYGGAQAIDLRRAMRRQSAAHLQASS